MVEKAAPAGHLKVAQHFKYSPHLPDSRVFHKLGSPGCLFSGILPVPAPLREGRLALILNRRTCSAAATTPHSKVQPYGPTRLPSLPRSVSMRLLSCSVLLLALA